MLEWNQFRLQVQETVRQAVKCAIQEDDRSKNFIIFGLVKTEKEQTDSKVVDLLGELGVKPRLTASRIKAMRSVSDSNYCRPAKCNLTSLATVVREIVSIIISRVPGYTLILTTDNDICFSTYCR